MTSEGGTGFAAEVWRRIGAVATAHVVMLRDAAVVDDAIAAALLSAMDGVRRGSPPPAVGLSGPIALFDERLDALVPAGAVGAGSIGRARADVAAAVARLLLRDGLVELAGAVADARRALIELAGDHAFTLMPAFAGGRAVQPTTFAHFLGGVVAPLGRAGGRTRHAFAEVNRSPLGAVALVGSGLPLDRERTSALLGFDGTIPSAFDAVAAVDHLTEVAGIAAAVATPLRRFARELLTWLRTDPDAFRLPDGWTAEAEPELPHFRPPLGLERMDLRSRRVEADAATVGRLVGDALYGPAATTVDAAIGVASEAIGGAIDLARRASDLARGLAVNRALLANRAGRDHVTSGDLAEVLVAEEGLEPAAARAIVGLTVRRAMEQGIEVGGITPEMIDAAALLVIGRELGVEIERIGRSVAPRRFLERRALPGGAAPAATRAYLEDEEARLRDDDRWRTDVEARLAGAAAALARAEAAVVAEAG